MIYLYEQGGIDMIKERRCSYEVCKLLHEKGFDVKCTDWYFENNINIWKPTHQMACDWLREVHKIFADPIKQGNYNDTREDYTYIVASNGTVYRNSSVCDKYSYEEAVEAALKYSLENLI